jgi:DNA-binding LytR/AlgR family response regulator
MLAPVAFARIHRSYIVRVDRVTTSSDGMDAWS